MAPLEILLSVLISKFEFGVTDEKVVWNLSQIISPSVQTGSMTETGYVVEEKKGLPLVVKVCAGED